MRLRIVATRPATRALAILAALVAFGAAQAQDTELPPASQLFAAHLEAIGGEGAVRKHQHRTVTGTMSIPAQGITGDLVVWASAPNLARTEIEIPGLGKIRQGYDGETAWEIGLQGPQVIDGDRLAQTAYDAEFFQQIPAEGRYKEAETVSREEFNGKDCYKVRVVTPYDDERILYYDSASGLLVGAERDVETGAGKIKMTARFDEYKDFDGVKIAVSNEQVAGPAKQIIEFSSVSHDAIEKAAYDLPTEIMAMLEPAPEEDGGDAEE